MARKGALDRFLEILGIVDKEPDDSDINDRYNRRSSSKSTSQKSGYTHSQRPTYERDDFSDREREESSRTRPGNVVNMRPNSSRQQTVIYHLHSLDECAAVISDLLDNKTVLLNLEDMDQKYEQRAFDMLSGAAFALKATLRQASGKTYLIAPFFVKVNSTKDSRRI